MALSVQTNTAAMTALKHLNTNSENMNKSLERLSSGFRVNSAADDASGFAVASKLDAQTGRLKAASQNATQASAMVKMADAGVNEIQNMINRIQTLATQASSANNAGELGKLDSERVKLESQIDKIANSTNYNGVNLLNGSDATLGSVQGTATTVATTAVVAAGSSVSFANSGTALFVEDASFDVTVDAAGVITSITSASDLHGTNGALLASAGTDLKGTLTTAGTNASITSVATNSALGLVLTATNGTGPGAGTTNVAVASGGVAFKANADYAAVSDFQVGADNNADNRVSIDLRNKYTTEGLGLGVGGLTTQAAAQTYLDTAKSAMDTLITQRADLGATQNQLSFVQANLATSIEQTTASVSSIKDADMAMEMAEFTKNKILTQAGTSMLAQANQASQNVLTLFR